MRRTLLLASVCVLGCGAQQAPVREPVAPVEVSIAEAEAAARDLAAHVDGALGVVVVVETMGGDGEPRPTRRATVRCGDEVTALAGELATYVATRPVGEAPGWSCAGADCELPGVMEYDPSRILRFGRSGDGRVVVRGYFAVDAIAVDPERLAQTRRNADRDYEELSRRGCE
jgi:hypothetical protein